MKKVIGALAVCAALAGAAPANAEAADTQERVDVACWGGYGGKWDVRYLIKPRTCAFNGDEAHAFQAPLAWMHWRTWGGPTACGRGKYVYNQGLHIHARFCLYGRIRDSADILTYTKIRGVTYGRWCSDHWRDVNRRVCQRHKQFHFRSSTA